MYTGPNIVTSGLVLQLDAANTKSYPGSGITWTDLSGNNNNGTLTNGPTFSSANGGSIVFDGTNDIITSFPTQISGIESKTICAFVYPTTSSRIGVCGTRPIALASGWALTLNRTNSGNLSYFHTAGSLIEVNAGISTNQWYHVSATYSTTTATATLYLNGNQIGPPSSSFSAINSSAFNGVIGAEQQSSATEIFRGNIASVQIYNRALSASEVLQNYNSIKSRFNL